MNYGTPRTFRSAVTARLQARASGLGPAAAFTPMEFASCLEHSRKVRSTGIPRIYTALAKEIP